MKAEGTSPHDDEPVCETGWSHSHDFPRGQLTTRCPLHDLESQREQLHPASQFGVLCSV